MSTTVRDRAELILDVSASLPFDEAISLAASVHLPDNAAEPPCAMLICWPGGSSARAYWDMQIPRHDGYSFAEHMTAQGYVVVACDHLGVGASGKPAEGDRVNFETMSAAAASLVVQVRTLLAEGAPELGGLPSPVVPVIGVGHSLGAALTAATQARHRCYDAVALLGFTHGSKELAVSAVGAAEAGPDADADAKRQTATEQARAFFEDTWDDVYAFAAREPNHGWLHRPDVPLEVIAADDAEAVRWPRQAYVEALLAGYTARFASELECPVFVGFGDHDVPPIPHADVAFYTSSHDVTFYVLRNSAHCHNCATTRAELWDRIGQWASHQGPVRRPRRAGST
ncbi:MAG TPA: alpha/beta hydrolase [Solirubrobacteraceae bacterium]|nr:alpha/beta hydrolase [Solirubrobacteraceae bacterium]